MKLVRTEDGLWVDPASTYVTSRDANGNVTLCELPAAEPSIEQRIVTVVWESGRAVTRREISKALGYTRHSTGWLNSKIDSLVDQGYLRRTYQPYRSNMLVYYYEIVG